MTATVSLSRCTTYDRNVVRTALSETLRRLGGMAAFVQPGQKVLLKPNLLIPAPEHKCVTTHPSIVWAVATLAREVGGIVSIGDSPALGTGRRVMQRCGIWPVVEELGLQVADFSESVERSSSQNHTFKRLQIARDVLEAGVVINLARVKTHGYMFLTLAVKNVFGCVVGQVDFQDVGQSGHDVYRADDLV